MPTKLIKGENSILTDLFNSIPGKSLQAGSAQARVTEGALVESVLLEKLPLADRDPQPTP